MPAAQPAYTPEPIVSYDARGKKTVAALPVGLDGMQRFRVMRQPQERAPTEEENKAGRVLSIVGSPPAGNVLFRSPALRDHWRHIQWTEAGGQIRLRPGDTLGKVVAELRSRFGAHISVTELGALNDIEDVDKLQVGQKVLLPVNADGSLSVRAYELWLNRNGGGLSAARRLWGDTGALDFARGTNQGFVDGFGMGAGRLLAELTASAGHNAAGNSTTSQNLEASIVQRLQSALTGQSVAYAVGYLILVPQTRGFSELVVPISLARAGMMRLRTGRSVQRLAGTENPWRAPANLRIPASSEGSWNGAPGNSLFTPTNPSKYGLKPGDAIPWQEGTPNFQQWADSFSVPGLTGHHAADRSVVLNVLGGRLNTNAAGAARWLAQRQLAIHHYKGDLIQLVPIRLHRIAHQGSAMEMRNMR